MCSGPSPRASSARRAPDADYVYFSEFFDGDLLRLSKQELAANPSSCKTLTPAGANLCMDEILADREIKDIRIVGDRLYFGSFTAFGWVDLGEWKPGAIYRGLESLREPERAKRGPLISGDLDVRANGTVIMNDYTGKSVFELAPAP